jgi:hypothetical protein
VRQPTCRYGEEWQAPSGCSRAQNRVNLIHIWCGRHSSESNFISCGAGRDGKLQVRSYGTPRTHQGTARPQFKLNSFPGGETLRDIDLWFRANPPPTCINSFMINTSNNNKFQLDTLKLALFPPYQTESDYVSSPVAVGFWRRLTIADTPTCSLPVPSFPPFARISTSFTIFTTPRVS